MSTGNLYQLTSPENSSDLVFIPQFSSTVLPSTVTSSKVQEPKFFKSRHAEKEKEKKRSVSSTNVNKKTESFVESIFSLEPFQPMVSSSNDSPEIAVVKKKPKRRVKKASKQKN